MTNPKDYDKKRRMTESDLKTIRILPRSGKREDWRMWSRKFHMRGVAKGYAALMDGTEKVPTTEEISTLKDEAALLDAQQKIKANDLDLLMSVNDTKSFNLIDEHPGDLHSAWKALQEEFKPKTAMAIVELLSEFNNKKFEDVTGNIDKWISELEALRICLRAVKQEIDDQYFMMHILVNLPNEFGVHTMQMYALLKHDTLTVNDLREHLKIASTALKKQYGHDGEEKALIMNGPKYKKRFKGLCRICGKQGHKAEDCWENEKNKAKRPKGWKPNAERDGKSTNQTNQRRNFDGTCWVCGEKGHKGFNCPKKQQQGHIATTTTSDEPNQEYVLLGAQQEEAHVGQNYDTLTEDTWLIDSAATCHMTYNEEGLYEVQEIKDEVIVGNKQRIPLIKQGLLDITIQQKDGTKTKKTLLVKVGPELSHHLISMPRLMKNGWLPIGCKAKNPLGAIIQMEHPKEVGFAFDQFIKSGDSVLMGVQMKRYTNQAHITMGSGKTMHKRHLHEILGHCGKDIGERTAKYLGIHTTGKLDKCENCALEKIRKKSIPKKNEKKETVPGGRLYLDISSIRQTSLGGNKHWILCVDEATNFKKSFFVKRKGDQNTILVEWFKDLKVTHGITIKRVRCNNSGENRALKKACRTAHLGIKFEFTAPYTPQQNGVVERAFPTLMGRTQAMMNLAGFEKKRRTQLWCEAANTATLLDNILIHEEEKKCPHELFFQEKPSYGQYLRTFGEMAIVKFPGQTTTKLDSRGIVGMFLGYCENHTQNVYRFLNMQTNSLIVSRDITWLGKLYGEYYHVKRTVPLQQYEQDDNDEDNSPTYTTLRAVQIKEEKPEVKEEKTDNQETKEDLNEQPQVKQLSRTMERRLEWTANTQKEQEGEELGKTRSETQQRKEQGNLVWDIDELNPPEHCLLMSAINSLNPDIPKKFREAWDHPDLTIREKWREAIHKEFQAMILKGVWRHVKHNTMESGRRLIGSKWVFAIKRNGIYRARLVALGYNQIPGVDFTENFAPVMNDITFRLMLTRKMVERLKTRIIDVETAFLYGDLEEEIYMNIPEGYVECGYHVEEDDVLLLQKGIYGLVQAARQYWKKFIGVMEKLGFKLSKADPCFMFRRNEHGICMISIYVDDNFLVGEDDAVDQTTAQLQEHFKVKFEDTNNDYLGCEFIVSYDGKRGWLGQPHIIKSLRDRFGPHVEKLKSTLTPGTTGYVSLQTNDGLLTNEQKTEYRSGTGTLLFLLKHSRPDLSNPVRELSKNMDKANYANYKEMLRIIKFVLDTQDYGLKFDPTKDHLWKLEGMSDSDFATDKMTRTSVTGFIIYFKGIPIAWRSRGQRGVVLSTTEAEYVALSEVVATIKFIVQLLSDMEIQVELPIKVYVDNVGAIFLANNQTTSDRTKHVDVRYHFIREYIENGTVKILFIRSGENDADLFTKNVPSAIYTKHARKIVWSKENVSEKNVVTTEQEGCQKGPSQDDVATRDMTSSNNQSDVSSRNDKNDGKTERD